MRNIRVLMIGNASSVKGGITSVIDQVMQYDWLASSVDLKFVGTYVEGGNIKKFFHFMYAYIKIVFIMVFYRPDVVHMHMSYKGSFTRKYIIHKLCIRFGIRDIIHLHGSEFEKWYISCGNRKKNKIKKLLLECDAFLVLGEKWNNIIKNIEPQSKIYTLGNTVHIPEETSEWNDERFQVLFLGVLIKRKGVEDLLQAIYNIKDSAIESNVHFVIAGSGKEEDSLKFLSEKLKIDSMITFTGWTDGEKKKHFLKNSQMLVLPSYNEGLPIAILEAISYGLPIVATDVGDISSAVKENINGYLVQPGDIKRLGNAIKHVYSNENKWNEMSLSSKAIARDRFSEANYFELLRKIWINDI